jgi:hypothetical protein
MGSCDGRQALAETVQIVALVLLTSGRQICADAGNRFGRDLPRIAQRADMDQMERRARTAGNVPCYGECMIAKGRSIEWDED